MSQLQKAARFDLATLINKWAPNSLELREKDNEGSVALYEATKAGFEDVIGRLTKDDKVEDGDEFITYYTVYDGGISNNPERRKEIAFTNTIKLRKKDVVFILLYASVAGNCRDEVGVPTVHLAIETGSLPILQLLLDKDTNPEVKAFNHDYKSTLHLAARHGMPDAVDLRLYKDVDLPDIKEKGRTIPFSKLEATNVQAGHNIIRIFLQKRIDIREGDQSSRNILHAVVEKGYSRTLRSLIYRVEDYSLKDAKGKTLFDYAHEGGHKDAARILRG